VQWVACLTRNVLVVGSGSSKSSVVSLVLVGSRNGFEHDFTIKLKQIKALMEE